MTMIHGFLASVGPFFLLLGLLIFVHELGHFLVAKYFQVRVETFSLGFGKKLLSWQYGETTYCLSLIPLGGYVKMFGDDPSVEVAQTDRARAFLHKPVMQRIAIVLAGPIMNLIFAFFLFLVIGGVGEDVPGPVIGDVAMDSKAYGEGFRSGDKILSISGQPTPTWNQVRKTIESSGGKALEFTIERKSEAQSVHLTVSTSVGDNENIFSANRQVGQIPGLSPESRSTAIGIKDPKSPAGTAGAKTMDLIFAVNGKKVSYWRDLQPAFKEALAANGKSVQLQVRDLEHAEKADSTRTLTVDVPKGWDEKTDLPAWLGIESAELYMYQIKKGSPAEKAGVLPKDKVIQVDHQDVANWNAVLEHVKNFDPQKPGMDFTIVRDGVEHNFQIRPEMTKIMTAKGQEEKRFTIGIYSGYLPLGPENVYYRLSSPIQIVRNGFQETLNWSEFVIMSVVRLIEGDVSAKNLGGVISIGRVASHSFAAGFSTFLRTMAIISINLFLLNLLPVPILDGGHLVFYTIEGLRGAPLSMRKMELAQQIGLMLLMILMVFAFFNDITNLFSNRW